MSEGLYIYAIAVGNREEDFKLGGLQGKPVRALAHQGLIAIVQDCEPKTVEIKDQKLLANLLLIHQSVVDFAWERHETMIPLSFGTIIKPTDGKSASENLNEWLEKESTELRQKLERLRNKAEYGVQILWDASSILKRFRESDPVILKLEREIRSKPEGVAYLLQRKLEDLIRQRLEQAAGEHFKNFYKRIWDCVKDVHIEKLRKEEPPKQMILNVSCLQEKGHTAALSSQLEGIGRTSGFDVRFTGPWPPYSFT